MHSLDLFIIKMGTLGSRVRLCPDFRDDTAAPREPWLAAWVLEIMSPEVIQQIPFLKTKIRLSIPLQSLRSQAFQRRGTRCAHTCFSLSFQTHPQGPQRGSGLSALIEVRKDHTKTQGKAGDVITHCFFYEGKNMHMGVPWQKGK